MICLYILAFVAINGDDLLYKIVGFACLILQIPLLTTDLIFITDASGTLASATIALDTTLKSIFVFVNVLFQFLFLYHMWQWSRAEEA